MVELDNFPQFFKKEYQEQIEAVKGRSDQNFEAKNLEEKYNQNLKEMILCYLSISETSNNEIEKINKLEDLKRKYMKTL